MVNSIVILGFALVGAGITTALAILGDTDAVLGRGELLAYGLGGALLGGLMSGFILWGIGVRE